MRIRDSKQTERRIGGGAVVMRSELMLRLISTTRGPGSACSQILRRSSGGRSWKQVKDMLDS